MHAYNTCENNSRYDKIRLTQKWQESTQDIGAGHFIQFLKIAILGNWNFSHSGNFVVNLFVIEASKTCKKNCWNIIRKEGNDMKSKIISGIPTQAVCNVTGVKRVTLSTWKLKGIVSPSVREIQGRGGDLWSFGDLIEVKTIVKLKDMGLSLQKIRKVVTWLKSHGYSLNSVILRVAGDSVEAFTDEGLAWDVLKRQGQGVFVFWQGIVNTARSEYETYKVELKEAA